MLKDPIPSPEASLPSCTLRAGKALLCGMTAGLLALAVAGCSKPAPPPPAPAAMPVQVQPVSMSDVPRGDTYVATIKSRRTTTVLPQVDGRVTRILVHSGQNVKSGQLLLQIDPLKQLATVQQGVATELQSKAQYQYNQLDVERQRQLYAAGVISKQAFDQATQSFGSTQGAYNAASAATQTQREELVYYQVRAPFAGIVGDIPVHQGDYVSPTTTLTTVDEDRDLEAYIYVPTERSSLVHNSLPVELLDTAGKTLAKTAIYFVSPQVDNTTQSILAKAPVAPGAGAPQSADRERTRHLGQQISADHSRACRHQDRRRVVCLPRCCKRQGLHRASFHRHLGRSHREQLSGDQRPETGRPGHRQRSAVSAGRRPRPSVELGLSQTSRARRGAGK